STFIANATTRITGISSTRPKAARTASNARFARRSSAAVIASPAATAFLSADCHRASPRRRRTCHGTFRAGLPDVNRTYGPFGEEVPGRTTGRMLDNLDVGPGKRWN